VLASAGNGQDLVSQLEELAPLQESGFLSAEEVAAAKANLLDAPLLIGRAVPVVSFNATRQRPAGL